MLLLLLLLPSQMGGGGRRKEKEEEVVAFLPVHAHFFFFKGEPCRGGDHKSVDFNQKQASS